MGHLYHLQDTYENMQNDPKPALIGGIMTIKIDATHPLFGKIKVGDEIIVGPPQPPPPNSPRPKKRKNKKSGQTCEKSRRIDTF